MSFTLSMSGVVVGRSELENRDAARRIVSGVFRPGLGYELVQPIFALYDASNAEVMERYRKSRDALQLQLTTSTGAPIAIRDLRIRQDVAPGAASTALVIEFETDDPAIWS